MRFRFIGQYTNGHSEVCIYGVRFIGHDPVTVDNDDTALNLMTHQEVEEVPDVVEPIASAVPPVIAEPAKRRGRPNKVSA